MIISSHLEYALGEYGAFEYGLETLKLPSYTDFEMLGVSGTSLQAGEALQGSFEVKGVGYNLWRRGAHVLITMDPAYDTVPRPYEERTVRWK